MFPWREDTSEFGRVPSGQLAHGLDGSPALSGADEVDGEVADHRHVAGAMSTPEARLILFEGDVEHPVQAVFDTPVATHALGKALGGAARRMRGNGGARLKRRRLQRRLPDQQNESRKSRRSAAIGSGGLRWSCDALPASLEDPMTQGRQPLAELMAKAGDDDFLCSLVEAAMQMMMEADVEGPIGALRHERSASRP